MGHVKWYVLHFFPSHFFIFFLSLRLEACPDFVRHYWSCFCVANVVWEFLYVTILLRKHQGAVYKLFVMFGHSKRIERGRYVLPQTVPRGGFFLPWKRLQWAQIKIASPEPPNWVTKLPSPMSVSPTQVATSMWCPGLRAEAIKSPLLELSDIG